jgi:hypothetical protein
MDEHSDDHRERDYTPRALIPSRYAETLPEDVVTRRKEMILQYLAEGWSARHACEMAGCTPPTLRNYRQADPGYDEQVAEAIEMGTDALEDTALKRARFGVDKPVFYQGEVVGSVREYSDTLLIFLLKGRRPEKYTERMRTTLEVGDANATFTFDTGNAAPERIVEARNRDAEDIEISASVPEGPVEFQRP